MKTRIISIERKDDGLARIGRVTFSQTGKTLYYRGRKLQSLGGRGYKANYFDVESGEHYWISGCKKGGGDTMYGGTIQVDEDAREEYWSTIRGLASCKDQKTVRCDGNVVK